MKLYTINTVNYFDAAIIFKFLGERIIKAGSLWIELWLHDSEAILINEHFKKNIVYIFKISLQSVFKSCDNSVHAISHIK